MAYPNIQSSQEQIQQQMPNPNPSQTQVQQPEDISPKKSKWWLWALVALGVLILAGAVYYFFLM